MTVTGFGETSFGETGFFDASKVLIVAGKGGVGKTTVGATIGLAAAQSGKDVLLIELEGNSTLGFPFGISELTFEEQVVRDFGDRGGRVRARRVTPDEAFADYLGAHGLDRVSGRLAKTGAIEVVSTAAPGIRDLLALGLIRSLEEAASSEGTESSQGTDHTDLIVVDAPAAGHAISFLRSPAGLLDSASSGPVHQQAHAVMAMLSDGTRCQVILVTTPEETPVTETIETAFALEEEVGVQLGPVVVNGNWSEIPGLREAVAESSATNPAKSETVELAAAKFRIQHLDQQAAQRSRLASELPLDQIHLPNTFTAGVGPDELQILAESLIEQIVDPVQ